MKPGDVVLAASRMITCVGNQPSPRFAKLRIDAVDVASHSVSITLVIDPNCGYLGLEPGGIPAQ